MAKKELLHGRWHKWHRGQKTETAQVFWKTFWNACEPGVVVCSSQGSLMVMMHSECGLLYVAMDELRFHVQ
jgi:hypothetical protein